MGKPDDAQVEVVSAHGPERIVRVSHASRVVFPATGITPAITKLDLVHYIVAMGDPLMRALRDRPTTLERWPQGVQQGLRLGRGTDDGGFYQKHMMRGAPPYADSVEIEFPSGRSARELCPTEPAVLAWCAQMGTVTFHPWPVRRTEDLDSLDRPDELRIDLDPQPGNSFEDVVAVALAARDLFHEFGISAYCKTSGGRGVHVYVRIQPNWGFLDVRHAAIAFGRPVAFDDVYVEGIRRVSAVDIAFANDTDADRHGIVTRNGLMPSNDYLATCAFYLGSERSAFQGRAIGKTVVSSAMIDRVAGALGRAVFEVPVGFKWFVDGLTDGSLYFSGEESAGSSFLRRDASVWTTDKDGLIAGLLAAEITARTGSAPDALFAKLAAELGRGYYARIDRPADADLRARLARVTVSSVMAATLGGDAITGKIVNAPGNNAPIGGIKLSTAKGWIAARPSGTEDIYKIYAESFVSAAHLQQLQRDAAAILQSL